MRAARTRGAISTLRAAGDYDAGAAVASAPRVSETVSILVFIFGDKTAAAELAGTRSFKLRVAVALPHQSFFASVTVIFGDVL
jgi:hypothetical protein